MLLNDFYALGFNPSASCPRAWRYKGEVICRELGKHIVTVLWQGAGENIEVLVGHYESPTMLYCGPMHSEPMLHWLVQDFGLLHRTVVPVTWVQRLKKFARRRIGRGA
jgi:hypothetical protein